ncbi:Uncharacterised protein [Mycobacteroides abscessus subsp. abscessus]|nr:Uncharacterised protein [Mycobacteroides abscessus subsp. abscessus]
MVCAQKGRADSHCFMVFARKTPGNGVGLQRFTLTQIAIGLSKRPLMAPTPGSGGRESFRRLLDVVADRGGSETQDRRHCRCVQLNRMYLSYPGPVLVVTDPEGDNISHTTHAHKSIAISHFVGSAGLKIHNIAVYPLAQPYA